MDFSGCPETYIGLSSEDLEVKVMLMCFKPWYFHLMKRLVLVCFLLMSPALVEHSAADERAERLERGEVIVNTRARRGHSVPEVRAVGLVRATPAKVWEIISRCQDYVRTMPRTVSSEELSRRGSRIRCRIVVDMPFPIEDLVSVTNVVHSEEPDGGYKREWTLHEGDFRVNRGSWTLRPNAGGQHTLLVYKFLSIPNVEIPAVVRQLAQQKAIPNIYEKIRQQVE